jgi:polyisoprenoid-binding protein YceI
VRRAVAALVATVVAVLVGVGAYWRLSGDEAPPPPTLPPRATVEPAPAGARWTLTGGSFAGYRVDEEYLGGVGVKTAVGRTTALSGTLRVDGTTVVSAQLEADLTQLRSDQSRRDDALRTRGIETGRYPTARFSLLGPVKLGDGVEARGLLMLHGHRAPIAVTVDGALSADQLELAGTAPIDFEDFAIEPPSVAGLVTVRSHGTLEFQLVARRA